MLLWTFLERSDLHPASPAVNIIPGMYDGHGKALTPNSMVQEAVFDYDPANIANGESRVG